ncbi:MAG: DUF455 family protein [Myxococcota bacterium]|nr:DUF455 family protein [Myxococcota bacterium]
MSPPHQQDGAPLDDSDPGHPLYINHPVRNPEIAMASGLPNLPRVGALKDPEARIQCLARFAHHELMAVELFAWALLRWPELPAELRREFTRALADEQRHCRMYIDRVVDLGGSFFKPPYSNYFWKHVPAMSKSPHGPSAFLAAMGLTLEQANLDFTLMYRDAFTAAGDKKSADVMQRIHDDEVRHVALAARWIKLLGPPGTDIIEAYTEAVPFPLSAARAKGRQFDVTSRRRAGLGQPFIDFVRDAQSSQNRKQAKRPARDEARAPKGSPLLYPNIGGEELPGKAGAVITDTTAPTLRLWRMLFGPQARFLPVVVQKDAGIPIERLHRKWWPEGLGPMPERAAFDWLDGATGVVPWISTARLPLHPTSDGPRSRCASAGVVARVHDKAFAHAVAREEHMVPSQIRDSMLVLDSETLLADDAAIQQMEQKIAQWPGELGHNFTLKPRLGTSGRGRVPGVDGKVDSPAVRGALKRLSRRGGAILEPWLKRKVDLCAQMHVSDDGDVTLLGTMEQIVAPSGVYIGHRGEFDSRGRVFTGGQYEEQLREAAAITARRAYAEGFHGPCGIDAFSFELPDAEGGPREILRSLVEFNARFTMGTIAIGLLRRTLDRAREALALEPGERRAFYFGLDTPEGGWEAGVETVPGRKLLIPLWRDDHDSVKPALLFAETREALDEVVARAPRVKRKRPPVRKANVA